ncbi:hypothetical protein [Natronoglomus mannanivorans]|uniref:PGF-CTERM protein n=1 Tax=Natronoglomus mannanivorans TaxID=2979990 RepID=A0AAP2YXE4_9EURY|nr:hypothetical protein [Halobacteria archaeon AArc-xg1-1]
MDDLEGEGLPPAEFVYADSETATRRQYETGESEGTITTLDVSDDGVPFSEATRFEVTEQLENNWDVQLRTAEWASDPYRSVEAGQVLLGVAYLRAPEGEGTGTAQYIADNSQSDVWNSVVGDVDYQEPPAEWQRYFFPIEFDAAADGSAFEWSTQFHLGFDVQTVDVGGIALLDFGQDVNVDDLPSGAVADEYEETGDDSDETQDEDGEDEDTEQDSDDGQEQDEDQDTADSDDSGDGDSSDDDEDEGEGEGENADGDDETQDETETETDGDDETQDETEAETDGDGAEESLPGFGAIGGLAGLGATVSYLLSRTNDERSTDDDYASDDEV